MAKINPIPTSKLRKIFEKAGFTCVRIEGDHKVKKTLPNWDVVIPPNVYLLNPDYDWESFLSSCHSSTRHLYCQFNNPFSRTFHAQNDGNNHVHTSKTSYIACGATAEELLEEKITWIEALTKKNFGKIGFVPDALLNLSAELLEESYKKNLWYIGAPATPGLFNSACQICGWQFFITAVKAYPRLAEKLLQLIWQKYREIWSEFLQTIGDRIDIIEIADDLAGEKDILISLVDFQKLLIPFYQELIRLIKNYTSAKILFHSCGDIAAFLPELEKLKVDLISPLEAMVSVKKRNYLAQNYSQSFIFHGVLNSQLLTASDPESAWQDWSQAKLAFGSNASGATVTSGVTTFIPALELSGLEEISINKVLLASTRVKAFIHRQT